MMNLFFLRHGKAHSRGPKWRPDSRRPLTGEGEENMFDVARGMRALGLSFDVILSSPYARALRTAEILGEVYDTPKLIETRRLTPEAAPKDIVDEINDNFAGAAAIVLVGHEPFLTRLISTLVSGTDGLAIELKKAGLCKLSVEKLVFGQCATLHWLMTPKPLGRLGKRT
jgi:phosphohistidine phosphatase